MTQQHKLAQHHRHGDVEASPFGSWEIPSMERALHSLHVLPLYPAARLNPTRFAPCRGHCQSEHQTLSDPMEVVLECRVRNQDGHHVESYSARPTDR